MGIENRPYVGTWRLNQKKTVRHTPDALVYLNGDLTIAGCPTCGGRVDIQQYVTQVSVDPSTEGPATASIEMHIPKHAGDPLFRDANFVIHTGLEVHVYMRGYFPAKGLMSGITPDNTGGLDVRNAVVYPYYMVFHGVITDVNHSYSGGEHMVSISCADMLHFWQYQRMATSGSLFGARPTNSKVHMSLVGHTMTGMSPYAIIYQLFRDVQGSAGGVEFALGNKTNASANSTVVGESLFSLSILYWQKRFSQTSTSLRMYGADGSLYNGFQAAFLSSLNSSDPQSLAKKYVGKNAQSYELDPLVRTSRAVGFNPFSVGLGASGTSGTEGQIGINVAALQAFASDISQWGSVNLFETQYVTKLEVANTVKAACGFEFYQDVDGDIVFKPPFYNLDTQDSRVYRLEDVDIISFNAVEKEPEATVVKATGGHFQNMKGFGLENNEWGTRAEFVDYRAVAQYGWRQQTFETTYHTNPQAMFFAAVARYDIFNIGTKSASCTIPLRPELRPGYPVYIPSMDCYYYLHSFNHSLSFGGQCTTTLNLVGKRSKFFAPGQAPQDGSKATIDNIDLSNMHYPPLPLEIVGNDGVPRLQGFPNVVMTIDPELVNPLQFAAGVPLESLDSEDSIRSLIGQVRSARYSPLQQDPDAVTGETDEKALSIDGPFRIQTGANTYLSLPTVSELLKQAKKLQKAYAAKDPNTALDAVKDETAALQSLCDAVQDVHRRLFPEKESSATYLELLSDQKAAYNPGSTLPGYYRYYSCSHPDPNQQGPKSLQLDGNTVKTGDVFQLSGVTATQFVKTASGGNDLQEGGQVQAGIPIPNAKSGSVAPLSTADIRTFNVASFSVESSVSSTILTGGMSSGFPAAPLARAMSKFLFPLFEQASFSPSDTVDVFSEAFAQLRQRVGHATGATLQFHDPDRVIIDLPGDGITDKLQYLADDLAAHAASGTALWLGTVAKSGITSDVYAKAAGAPDADSETLDALKRLRDNPTPTVLQAAWAGAWPAGTYVVGGGTKARKTKTKTKTKTHHVPVFPVSDERGYHVVGTYAYGRGLTIDSINELGGFNPSTDVDYEEVESFLSSIRSGTDYSSAVGKLSASAQAVLASGTLDPNILRMTNPGGTVVDHQGRNFPSSTSESTQKVSVINAAYSLSALSADINKKSVCSCRGAEADALLQAFNESAFVSTDQVDIGDTSAVQDWLRDQAAASEVSWSATQSAYRGEVLDTDSTGLFDAVQSAVKNYSNLKV